MTKLLGAKVRDKITGFQGVVTGYVVYITGCNQALVVPPVKPDGDLPESQWVDEQRLEVAADARVTLDNGKSPGADRAPPRR